MEGILDVTWTADTASYSLHESARDTLPNWHAICLVVFRASTLVSLISGLSLVAGCESRPAQGPAVVNACGATINVQFDGAGKEASQADLLNWIRRAGEAVCTYSTSMYVAAMAYTVG